VDAVEIRARHVQTARGRAGGQDRRVERHRRPTRDVDGAGRHVEGGDGAATDDVDVVGGVVVRIVHEGGRRIVLAAQHGLRQRRAFVREMRFRADDDNPTVEPVGACALRSFGAGEAPADDDDASIRCGAPVKCHGEPLRSACGR
jgi:hypothetical protein